MPDGSKKLGEIWNRTDQHWRILVDEELGKICKEE